MSKFLNRFAKNESGATAIEYGLIAALVAVAIVTAMTLMGPALLQAFQTVTDSLVTAAG
jgi:pilus assembly protein Flp/PilA